MPKIDSKKYDAAEVTEGGSFAKMTAGGYVVRIQAVRTKDASGFDYVVGKQYVKLIYDVDEGEFAGKFSDPYWEGEKMDWGHQIYWSWKNVNDDEWAMERFKRQIHCFDESNPGFDAKAAFEADKWQLFIGKRIGIVLGEEEYIGNDGSVKTRFTFPNIKSVQDIQAGKFKVPPLKKLPDDERPKQASAEVYDDVPF